MSILKKINRMFGFGFGIVDSWAMIMSCASAIMGVGFGMYIIARLFVKPENHSGILALLGIAILVLGGIVTEISHRKLKKNARNEKKPEIADSEKT